MFMNVRIGEHKIVLLNERVESLYFYGEKNSFRFLFRPRTVLFYLVIPDCTFVWFFEKLKKNSICFLLRSEREEI